MNSQKIVIDVIGKTLLVPINATFCYNNGTLEIYSSNFSYKVAIKEIQRINLLDPENATSTDLKLVEKLPPFHTNNVKPVSNIEQGEKDPKSEIKKDKTALDLQSGMI